LTDSPTIYVVDDDEAVRESLAALLGSLAFQVETFESGTAFLAALAPEWLGCLILDIRMPGLSGQQVQQAMTERKHPLPVIFVTGHGDLPMAVKAMKAGAADFIEKPFSEEALMESIEHALALNQQSSDGQDVDTELAQRIDNLTPREREVLVQVAAGNPNKVIAYELDISPRTVEVHRARVIEKMNARNLSHLVRLAIRAGLLPDDI